jgi:hypothetical protein
METVNTNRIAYIVACIGEFARATGLTTQEAFRYLFFRGGIDFLVEHYEAEHLLSFDDVVEDLKTIARQSGGLIA